MKNSQSSSGIGEDIIRAIQQFGAAEMHLKTLYEKTFAELENGIIDVSDSEQLERHTAKLEDYRQDLIEVAELRRHAMMALFELFEDGDKDVWCLVKHLGIGAMTMFEAWQASDSDPKLLHLSVEANKAFIRALTRFIGTEITDCASCLSDFLKGKDNDKIEGL